MSKGEEKLQDAMGLISDDYILEAHGAKTGEELAGESGSGQVQGEGAGLRADAGGASPEKRKKRPKAPLAIAACLLLMIGVGAFAMSRMASPAPAPEVRESAETGKEAASADSASSTKESTAKDGYTLLAADGATAGAVSVGVPATPSNSAQVKAGLLTAAVWNDNVNWPFFANLVNAGTVAFPSYGIDPTHRVKATVNDAAGNPVRDEEVVLVSASGEQLWKARSGKDGAAYLFYREGQQPAAVTAGGTRQALAATQGDRDNRQGSPAMRIIEDVSLVVDAAPATNKDLQVMFIVDTTGSMSDELAYLQADFAAIAGDVGSDDISYSANFYRDQGDAYVTKRNGFTSDISTVQRQLNDEYADGGGDTPEAVAEILAEAITGNAEWRDDCRKIAFLVFDAPPHDGTDSTLDAAVRSAAERGIALVPVVASNAERDTELFGRALAICTNGTYVFLTDDSGIGDAHLEPIVGDYTVEPLHDIIVRLINDAR